MAEPAGQSSTPNGTVPPDKPAFPRLSSFKLPRDLTLGGVKTNKKVFAPNLKATRNKNKRQEGNDRDPKKEQDKGRRDRKNDRNRIVKNGPNIIKGTGVFSEGMGASERRSSHISYGRHIDTVPTLQPPTIRVKDVWKIDKELEDQKGKIGLGYAGLDDEEAGEDSLLAQKDAPVRLPLARLPGSKHYVPQVKEEDVKPEVKPEVKEEPDHCGSIPDVKKRAFAVSDLASLIRSERPTLMLLQFPDSLPRSEGAEATEAATCGLASLGEGRVGRLLVHKSGRVRLELGTALFEMGAGTQPASYQEAVSVAADAARRSANLVALGPIGLKLDVEPDWEALVAHMAL